MSWATVWAVLMHPRGRLRSNPDFTTETAGDSSSTDSLLSIQTASKTDDEILTTRGMIPAADSLLRQIRSIEARLNDHQSLPRIGSGFPGPGRSSRETDVGAVVAQAHSTPIRTTSRTGTTQGSVATEEGRGGELPANKRELSTNKGGRLSVLAQSAPHTSNSSSTIHRVQDGDTLPGLAQRYLGDASLWSILYQLNRDRIPSPDLLPLGTPLLIQPLQAATGQSGEIPLLRIKPEDASDLPPLEPLNKAPL